MRLKQSILYGSSIKAMLPRAIGIIFYFLLLDQKKQSRLGVKRRKAISIFSRTKAFAMPTKKLQFDPFVHTYRTITNVYASLFI